MNLDPSKAASDLAKKVEAIDLYFRSGNDVSIQRASIPAKEWDALKEAIKEAFNVR